MIRILIILLVIGGLIYGGYTLVNKVQVKQKQAKIAVNKKPEVSLIGIKNNETISKIIPVEVKATDDKEIVSVKFYFDDVKVRVDNEAPYCLKSETGGNCTPWDSKVLKNGPHTLTVAAYDDLGQRTLEITHFIVKN